jgi:O-antigen ligase
VTVKAADRPGGRGFDGLPRLAGLPVLLWGPGADRLAGWLLPAFAFALPISVSADAILLGLILVLLVTGGRWGGKLTVIRANPAAIASIVLFLLLLVGTLWSEAGWKDRVGYLGHYIAFAVFPLLLPLCRDPEIRRQSLWAFLAAMALTLLFSLALHWGWLPPSRLWHGYRDDGAPFRPTITQSLLLAFAAYLAVLLARECRDRHWRWGLWMFAAMSVFDVLFIVPGRTGYVVLALLILYLGHLRFGWHGVLAGGAVVLALLAGAFVLSPTFHARVDQAIAEARQSSSDKPALISSSIGLRLEYWRNSLALIRESPIVGHGTGGYPAAYARLTAGEGMLASRNPHNDWLHIGVQLGVVGIVALIAFYGTAWWTARALPTPFDRALARGLILAFLAGGLFNTLLMDHTEERFFTLIMALAFATLPAGDRKIAGARLES